MKPVIVIGLGNPLLRDEGVGLVVVQRLAKQGERFSDTDFLEAGTSLMGAMRHVAGRHRAIVVDCAFMGEPVGTIRRFTPDHVRSVKRISGYSLHEGDLLSVLDLSRRLGEAPNEVIIFGIEPADVSIGEGLSDLLQAKVPHYVDTVAKELIAGAPEVQ